MFLHICIGASTYNQGRGATQRRGSFNLTTFKMRIKQKNKLPAVQLCLFSETEMSAMTEQITIKPIELFTADPARLYWQLEIGQALRGKEGREHRRTFTQRRARVRVATRKLPEIFTANFKT